MVYYGDKSHKIKFGLLLSPAAAAHAPLPTRRCTLALVKGVGVEGPGEGGMIKVRQTEEEKTGALRDFNHSGGAC